MVILGAALSAAIIPTCAELMEAARRERCENRASAFISGWLNSIIFAGEFLGPFLGGLLLDEFGSFQLASSYFAALCLTVTTLGAIGYCLLFVKRKWQRRNEPDGAAYIRQTQRNRRIRRRRTRTTSSMGPRSLSESFSASMRFQWNEREGEDENQN